MTPFEQHREIRIVEADNRTLLLEQFNDGESRRFAKIIHIFLVRHSEDQDARAIERFADVVEGGRDRVDDVVRHGDIDLASQFDEASLEIPLFGLPREIKRIDGNAVPAKAGPGIKGVKAKGLCRSSVDNLPNIDAHAEAQELQFINEGDVHTAV